jgi:foldase protein PrsA
VVVGSIMVSNGEEYKKLAADRKTVATCNGFDIPYEELRFVTMFYKDSLEGKYGKGIWDDPATAELHRDELERLVKENLCENYVVLSTCRQLGIPTDSKDMDAYVDAQIKELRAEFDSKKEYGEWLDEQWMTEHYLRFNIGISYLESAIYYTLLDNDLYEYRHDNMADFLDYVENSGDYVRTVHVYIENVDGEDPAENLAKAMEISETLRAIADDEDRRWHMNEYIGSAVNDDFQNVSGDGYYFTKREMDEDYEKAAFGLAIGEVSEPVVCRGGNFIIMRLPLEPAHIMKKAQDLLNNYHSVCLGIYEDQFRPDCVVEFNEYGAGIDILAIQ